MAGSAGADEESELVRELRAAALAQEEKVATTFRLTRRTMRRLKAQERRWNTSMSFITERALEPALTDLERAEPPGPSDRDAEDD